MKIKEIIKVTGGKLISGSPNTDIDPAKISTDSRSIKRGGLFIALKGPNFNGNDFVNEAFNKGASGAIVTKYEIRNTKYEKVILRVNDGAKALGQIAAYHRRQFNIPVIAVTGSNGKTTVKEMISSVLGTKYNVLKNEGTKNNHIGVPQTLLGLNRKHEIAVLELGANHAGEIDELAEIVKPDTCVITNIGPSHLEFFGSMKGVFSAKRELIGHLKRNGLAVLNGDDEYLSKVSVGKFRIVRFGLGDRNDYRAADICMGKLGVSFTPLESPVPLQRNFVTGPAIYGGDETYGSYRKGGVRAPSFLTGFTVNGREDYKLNLLGIHNVYNALGAIAVGKEFGIGPGSIKTALIDFRPACMRLNLKKIRGLDIINDSYNSNPYSMQAALEVIRYYHAPSRWVVSGDMLELGRRAAGFHREAGEHIARSGATGLLTFGRLSKYTLSGARACGMAKERLWHCATHGGIAAILKRVAKKGDVVLVKGSRGMKMEKVMEKLQGE